MGSVSFRLPADLTAAEQECLKSACLAGGYALAPVPTRHATQTRGGEARLTLTRDGNESGYLMVPWPAGQGTAVCLSATLRERDEPYRLLIELARGKLNQLRTQLAEWDLVGFRLDDELRKRVRAATRLFGQAVLDPADAQTSQRCRDVMAQASDLAHRTGASFGHQLAATRHAESGPLPARVGCRLMTLPDPASRREFLATFNAIRLVPSWQAIEPREADYSWQPFDALVEWAVSTGLPVSIGPVIDLADGRFPEWVERWDEDLPTIAAFYCDFAEQVISRYQAKVKSWVVTAGFNHADRFALDEDDRIRLAARLQEAAKQVAGGCEWTLSLALPWGDHLVSDHHTYSPLVFADTLVRAGCQFAAVELELLTGPGPRATPARDPVALYRLVNLFGILSIPLTLNVGRNPAGAANEIAAGLEMALALPQVQGVVWEAWREVDSTRLPGAALADGRRTECAALRAWVVEWRTRFG